MSPREHGWHVAAPWSVAGRFWMAWPAVSADGARDEELREDCLDLAIVLSDVAPVTLLANPADVAEAALRTPPGVGAMAVPHHGRSLCGLAPLWLVDQGGRPVCALAGGPVARAIADGAGLPALGAPAGLDFSGVDGDGEGWLIAAAEVIEALGVAAGVATQLLCDLLGGSRVLAVPVAGPLAAAARVVAPGVVAVADAAVRAALDGAEDAAGRRLALVELPSPKRRRRDGSIGSYADCVLAGTLVLVPAFGEPTDTEAQARLQAALPGRRVALHPVGDGSEGRLGSAVSVQPG